MKQIYPDYYSDFRCIAGECRHSCCIGWEIDIDGEALARYRAVPGEFGRRLNEGICDDSDSPCFRLGPDGRCPFLNADGLCDMILTLGEDALCEICADHPRFRSFFSDRTETGLGLCCEAACSLILGKTEPTAFEVFEDGEPEEPLTEFEEEILAFRSRLISTAQDRSRTLSDRLAAILREADRTLPERSAAGWAGFYRSLERLDPAWDDVLDALAAENVPSLPEDALSVPLEQLTVSLLFRHLPNAMDPEDLRSLAAFCVHAVGFIRSLCAVQMAQNGECSPEGLAELVRMYSSEIEYSDENIAAITAELTSE